MTAEHPKQNKQTFPEFLNLDSLLSERIDCFKNKLSGMLSPYAGEINYLSNDAPEMIGMRTSLSTCFDYLLLYSYQSLLFHGAKSLQVKLAQDLEHIIIDFINDGSQSLHQKFIEIKGDSPFPSSGLHPKDKRQIAWLVLSMQFLADQDARLLLHNESGKNIVSLRFPKSSFRTPRLEATVH
jgi:hypothetical protein